MNVFECCAQGDEVEEDSSCAASRSGFELDALAVDHITSTPLFEAIQRSDWSGVDFFLESGTFSFSPFQSDHDGCKIGAEDQVETWVICQSEKGRLQWRQLPIHAALCYGAPFNTIKELVRIYPAGLCCADTDGNLPLHLAVSFNRSDEILRLLLKAFPEGLEAANGSGKLPFQCAKDADDEAKRNKYELFKDFITCTNYLDDKALTQKYGELEAAHKSTQEAAKDLSKAKRELWYLKKFPLPIVVAGMRGASSQRPTGRFRAWKAERSSSKALNQK